MSIGTHKHFFSLLHTIPRVVLFSVALGLLVHVVVWTIFLQNPVFEQHTAGDGIGYFELATNLSQGNGFGRTVEGEGFVYETFRTPGIPVMLSGFFSAGFSVYAYLIFISLLGAMVIPIAGWYLGRFFFSPQVGIITAVLLAIEPLIYIHSWLLLTEIPFLITALVGVVLLVRAYQSGNVLSYASIVSALFLSAAVYIRPAALPVVGLSFFLLCVDHFLRKKKQTYLFVFIFFTMLLCLSPWYMRVHDLTGEYALSGTGWRNVYTDYLASIRALNNNTRFIDEKESLKLYAMERWGIDRSEINSPAMSDTFKAYALPEILSNKTTVMKLQTILGISYFTHSDYQRRLQKFALLPLNKVENGRTSSSVLLTKKGIHAIPLIYKEMENRYFIPVFERLWTVTLLLFAGIGFFAARGRVAYLFATLIVIGYATSSAIGLGVEGRLRLPILPFYFMLASCGILFVYTFFKSHRSHFLWKK